MSKHLQKMCLETKFQPVRLINDRDIERATWRAKEQLGLPVTVHPKLNGKHSKFIGNRRKFAICHISFRLCRLQGW